MSFAVPALVLFWINIGFYLILWCLSLLRSTFSPRRVLAASGPHFDDLAPRSSAAPHGLYARFLGDGIPFSYYTVCTWQLSGIIQIAASDLDPGDSPAAP